MIKLKYIYFLVLLNSGMLNAQVQDSIVVYLFMGEDCRICQYYTPILNDLYEEYKNDNIKFVGLFPNRYSTNKGIAEFKEKYGIEFPLKREFYQSKTKLFNVSVTPEVVVYNETKKMKVYQGRIDNSYHKVGKQRRVITHHELRDVLDSVSKGDITPHEATVAIGCFITKLKD